MVPEKLGVKPPLVLVVTNVVEQVSSHWRVLQRIKLNCSYREHVLELFCLFLKEWDRNRKDSS